MALSVPSSR
jgi:Flp pilus assembly pilin Flp